MLFPTIFKKPLQEDCSCSLLLTFFSFFFFQKLNEHCFERCVPKPGSSLSRGEETCFKSCMEKYMDAWNTVSKQYVARIQKEAREQGAGGSSF